MRLIPLETAADIETAHRWLSDPRHAKWLDLTGAMPLAAFAALMRRKHDLTYLFTDDTAQVPAGLIGIRRIHSVFRSGELWVVLGEPRLAARGLPYRATLHMLDVAFGERGLETVNIWVVESNQAANRIAKRVGFSFVGRLRRAHVIDGVFQSRLLYDLTRDEWEQRPKDRRDRHDRPMAIVAASQENGDHV
jgi:RimJ/RimL family protein N-acetyltransferase